MEIARRCIYCDHDAPDSSPAIVMPFVAHRALGYAPVNITHDWGLRDVPTGLCQTRCNTLHCACCGGLFMDLRFGEPEMAALYADYRGPAYTALREHYKPGYVKRNEALNRQTHTAAVEKFLHDKLPEHPRILDWGGDNGRNTPFRCNASCCHIVEISGKETLPGTQAITPDEALGGQYDLVVLSHVLEHLPSPFSLLEEIAPLLDRGAYLYIEVPYEALMCELTRTNEPIWQNKRHWHEHINFFSTAALEALIKRSGLVIHGLEERQDRPESSVLCVLCKSPATNEKRI
ncbi:class I SAM-dependent methyltransferase [Azonexus fungiphilus]|uniref:class I SAM-dependent methyltransferase n=1 Tax=Azonexus fungiphilus TaxID=146940 RepID=UPI00156BCB7B|nr:class I SAM-dependent methyltransferase [Azonexus fungiphilus]NHC07261.1 class I SAM-dependent methyltransferase [Azonexus fungiphilus]